MLSSFSHIQLCVTLWTLCSPLGSSVHGIIQARILKWVAMPFSRGIFLTQGLNLHLLCLLHWQVGSLPLAPPGKPYNLIVILFFWLYWIFSSWAYLSQGMWDVKSLTRNWAFVPCIRRAILNHWTTGEISSRICVFDYSAWDASSVTGDWTWFPMAVKALILNHWTVRKSPIVTSCYYFSQNYLTRPQNNLWDIGNGTQECFTRCLTILLIFSKSQLWIHFHTCFAVCYFINLYFDLNYFLS